MKAINGLLVMAAIISALAAGGVIAASAQNLQQQTMQTAFDTTIGDKQLSHKWSEIAMVQAGQSKNITALCDDASYPTGGGFALGSSDLQVLSSHAIGYGNGTVGWFVSVVNNNMTAPQPVAVDVLCLSEIRSTAATVEDDDNDVRTPSSDDVVPQTRDGGSDSSTEVVIEADGDWTGVISDSDLNMRSVDGSGDETIQIECDSGGIYSVSFQKLGERGELSVAVVQDGDVLKESSTSADYGVVSVTGEC